MQAVYAVYSSLFVSVLIVCLAVPMALHRVPPNGIYGYRTAKTQSTEKIWYQANTYAGKALIVAGSVAGVLSLATIGLLKSGAMNAGQALIAAVLFESIPLLVAVLFSARYVSSL